jgi:hypothetical protein
VAVPPAVHAATRALHAECQDVVAIDNITHRQLAELHIKDSRK